MIVCDQFTDERVARFFPPLNHEMEVHSSVDLRGSPSAVGLEVPRVMAIIGSEATPVRAENPMDGVEDSVCLAQGERIAGVQPFPTAGDPKLAIPRWVSGEDMIAFGEKSGVSAESLTGLTDIVVEVDFMKGPAMTSQYLVDTPFEEHEAAILPLDEPLPHMHDAFEDRKAFNVRGFINEAGSFVSWRDGVSGAGWLIDLCVMNAYASNRVEHGLLQYAIGNDAILQGLISVNKGVRAYLAHFDIAFYENPRTHGGMTFLPSTEPAALGYDRRFPPLSRQESARYERLRDASFNAMSIPREELK